MEIQVKGHSGCQIDIVNDGNNLYIYKSTHDPKYINRLYLQAKKQQEACRRAYQHIRIPEIFEIDKTDEHLIIKMEYIARTISIILRMLGSTISVILSRP